MRRGATLLAVAALLLLVPASAGAIQIHKHVMLAKDRAGPPIEAVRIVDVAPADSDQDGIADTDDNCPNTASTVNGGCPAPPPAAPPVETGSIAATTPDTSTVATGSASAIPGYITACESGGNYSAVNPSSGAYGAYQIMPSTSAAYGCDMSTPAGQDACAAKIYADVGSSAWSCG